IIPCREVEYMACSAGGPMEITFLNVDDDDTECKDCGKKFKRQRKKDQCPECGSEKLSPL
ncbi:MAG: hypothetical protein ACM3X8_05730, partial [Methanomicrobiales archaeon]